MGGSFHSHGEPVRRSGSSDLNEPEHKTGDEVILKRAIELLVEGRHIGVPLDVNDWETIGHDLPLLANIQPAGEFEIAELGGLHHRYEPIAT